VAAAPIEPFGELLQRHLETLATADETCRKAAEARRLVLRAAAHDGLNISLLKFIAKEQTLDPEVREELQEYRDACTAFDETPLAKAARQAREAVARAEAEAEEDQLEDETAEEEADELV
jgi:hypothetical protein